MASGKQRKGKNKQSGSESRKARHIIGFRATDDERARTEAAADRAGLTLSSYVRSRALAAPTTRAVRRPPVQTAQLAQLLGLIGAAGGDLQVIAQFQGGKGTIPLRELNAVLGELREAASAIMRLLGKRAHDH